MRFVIRLATRRFVVQRHGRLPSSRFRLVSEQREVFGCDGDDSVAASRRMSYCANATVRRSGRFQPSNASGKHLLMARSGSAGLMYTMGLGAI
jgi:hypothetical protein